MLVYKSLLTILIANLFMKASLAAASYYALSKDEDLFAHRQLEYECYSKCPVGFEEVGNWRNGECCGEPEECCEAGAGFYVLVLFIIGVIVLASCACCSCCPMYDSLCCSPNGPCSRTNPPRHTVPPVASKPANTYGAPTHARTTTTAAAASSRDVEEPTFLPDETQGSNSTDK